MKLGRWILVGAGLFGLVKVIQMLNLEMEEDVDEIKVNLKSGRIPEEDEYYSGQSEDVEYTDDEDILDELEEMDGKEVKSVVKFLSAELEESKDSTMMIEAPKKKVVKKVVKKKSVSKTNLTERQQKIMSQFDKQQKVETESLMNKFKGLNVRTLRRDLSKLEDLKMIKKIGKTKGSYYMKLS